MHASFVDSSFLPLTRANSASRCTKEEQDNRQSGGYRLTPWLLSTTKRGATAESYPILNCTGPKLSGLGHDSVPADASCLRFRRVQQLLCRLASVHRVETQRRDPTCVTRLGSSARCPHANCPRCRCLARGPGEQSQQRLRRDTGMKSREEQRHTLEAVNSQQSAVNSQQSTVHRRQTTDNRRQTTTPIYLELHDFCSLAVKRRVSRRRHLHRRPELQIARCINGRSAGDGFQRPREKGIALLLCPRLDVCLRGTTHGPASFPGEIGYEQRYCCGPTTIPFAAIAFQRPGTVVPQRPRKLGLGGLVAQCHCSETTVGAPSRQTPSTTKQPNNQTTTRAPPSVPCCENV